MLQPLLGEWPVHVFVNRSDLPTGPRITTTTIPLPRGPVFARAILYTLFTACAYALSPREKFCLRITTEGAFPFCDICYSQYCHKVFLSQHRDSIAGTGLRRMARIFTHRWNQMTERLAFHAAKVVVVPSQGIGRELESAYPSLVRGKIRVIANPVDVEYFAMPNNFDRHAMLGELGIPGDAFVLSFCALGHFERKGLRFIFEALRLLCRSDAYLIIVGGSVSEIREYRHVADQLNVSGLVRFVGLQNDIRPYLWASQVFVFPSAYEGFALACLQAAAAGLPLITTHINGVEEFIQNGRNGWIVERMAPSLAEAIAKAAAAPETTALLGRTAQQDVRQYKQENFQLRWLNLLEEQSAAMLGEKY